MLLDILLKPFVLLRFPMNLWQGLQVRVFSLIAILPYVGLFPPSSLSSPCRETGNPLLMKAYLHIVCYLIVWIGMVTTGLSAQSGWPAHPALQAAYDSLVQLAETYPDDSIARKSWLLHQSGLRASNAREFANAIGVTQRALDLRMSQEDDFGIEVVLSAFNLGTYYNLREEYRQALDHFSMVLNRAPHRKEGVAHYQCGIVYGLSLIHI